MTKDAFMRKYPEGMEFDVLGTTYTLHYDEKKCETQDAQGLCELYTKQIILSLHGYDSPNSFDKIEDYYKKVIRHELMHAFYHEMGLSNYSSDEILVDSMALKMPQIVKLMKGVI